MNRDLVDCRFGPIGALVLQTIETKPYTHPQGTYPSNREFILKPRDLTKDDEASKRKDLR